MVPYLHIHLLLEIKIPIRLPDTPKRRKLRPNTRHIPEDLSPHAFPVSSRNAPAGTREKLPAASEQHILETQGTSKFYKSITNNSPNSYFMFPKALHQHFT